MKRTRIFTFFLMLITTAAILSSCGKAGIAGKWIATEAAGEPIKGEMIYLELKADGTGTFNEEESDGYKDTEKLTWKQSGNKIEFKMATEDYSFNGTIQGNRITCDSSMDNIVFTKK